MSPIGIVLAAATLGAGFIVATRMKLKGAPLAQAVAMMICFSIVAGLNAVWPKTIMAIGCALGLIGLVLDLRDRAPR